MQFFIPTTVVIATVFGFLLRSIWFSPILFMKAWLLGEGITKKQLPKRSKLYILQINLYSFIAHGALTSVIALMFDFVQVSSFKVALSLGLLLTFGFIITTQFIDMIYTTEGTHWNGKHQVKFLINSLYYICVTVLISTVLFLFAVR